MQLNKGNYLMLDTTETKVEETSTVDNSVETKPNFMDLISPEYKEMKSLKNFESVDSLVKSYLSAQEMLGKRVKDLSGEEISLIDAKFGKPTTKEDYTFDGEESFKLEVLEAGLNDSQAARLYQLKQRKKEELLKTQEQERNSLKEKVEQELDLEFGKDLEARMEIASKVAKEHLGEDYELPLDPKLIKAFAQIGKKLYNHESVGTDQVSKFGLSASEARNELELLRLDPNHKAAKMSNKESVRMTALDREEYFLKKIYR